MGTRTSPRGTSMAWTGSGFVPVSNFAGTSTSFAPRGGLSAQGAGLGSLTVGGLGAGSSGMTGGGGSYFGPGQATVPTEKEQYNIRKNAVKKALTNLSNVIADARAFDKGVSGLTTEQKQQAVTDARKEIETLGITRDEIESFNKDQGREVISPRVVEGNLLDKVGDFTQDAGSALVDTYGTGALKALDAYTSLFGYDADELLKDSSVAFNPLSPGATYIFGEDGKVRTTPLGTTSAGNPVVLGGSIGAAGAVLGDLVGGDIGIAGIPGAAVDAVGGPVGAIQTATGALNVADDTQTKDKVTLDTTGVLEPTSDSGSSSGVKTTDTTPTSDPGNLAAQTDTPTTLIKDAPSVSIARPDSTAQDLDVAEIIRTNAGTDVPVTPAVTTEVKTSTPPASGGSSSGGSGLPAGGGGVAEIAGEPGELVEIENYIDMTDSLDAMLAQMAQEEDEDELPDYPYSGGGAVKRFSGKDDSYVLAPGASYGPDPAEEKGNIFTNNLPAIIGGGIGALFGLTSNEKSSPSGYQGGIPEYKYNRSLAPDAFSTTNADGTPRRPGSAGRSYFTQGTYDPVMETFTQDGEEITQQRTLGGAQRRADEAAMAAQAAEEEDYIAQIGQDFLDLQPVDTTEGLEFTGTITEDFINKYPNAGTGVVDTGAGAGAATPAATPAVTPPASDPLADVSFAGTAEELATGIATGPVQQPTTDTFSAYDAVVDQYNPDAITYDSGDINTVISAITDNKVGTANVAEDFGISESEVWGNLLRQGAYTPAGLASYIATNTNQPDYTEVDLIVRLLEDGQTSAEEVLAYYQNTDPEQFGNTTVEDVKEYFRKAGGTRTLAHGGMLQGDGYYLGGTTDGMADEVPATIGGNQPAALSDGEFVVPADVVSHLGNGNSDAGATQLYSMMDRVRKKRTGTTKQGTEINPMQQLPA